MQMAMRQMQVNGSLLEVCMAHEKLDSPQVGSGFHQMGGKTVSQGVRANPLLDSGSLGRFFAGIPDRLISQVVAIALG
jgi:hypothetical protein